MRRRVGIGRIDMKKKRMEMMKKKGDDYTQLKMSGVKERIDQFKTNLEKFAKDHKKEINKDPEFRHYFSTMCSKIGVDPLASSKGFWSELLGVGDFYYELSVQLSTVCYSTRKENGGLLEMSECISLLQAKRKKTKISKDDIKQAVKKLESLGNGFKVLTLNGKEYVQSIPMELNDDSTTILSACEDLKSGITKKELMKKLNWKSQNKTDNALRSLLNRGMAWVDEQSEEEEYWFPSLFFSESK